MYQISSKVCALFSGLRCPSQRLPSQPPFPPVAAAGWSWRVHWRRICHAPWRSPATRNVASPPGSAARCLHRCRPLIKWPSPNRTKAGKMAIFSWRCGRYDEFLLIFVDLSLMIYMTMVIIVVYFSGNCSWFSPYFGMFGPCWAQREAGIGDTRMLYCTHRCE